ncbi:MAG TPA: hypothetical protein VH394_00290 [Thermoanaerobaculia bacterium]|jgi:hypothetical protein|nr:hypothetical protein [Thermoanaerobaculia bacterium]
MSAAFSPLLRFHLRVGARLALRVMVPVFASATGGLMLLGIDFINSLSVTLFGARGKAGSGLPIAFICLGVAWVAAPRVCRGIDGWLRHLPATGLAHRRSAQLAIAAAQGSILALLVFLVIAAARNGGDPWPSFTGLLVAAPAAALAAMPVQRFVARPIALAAAFLPFSGGWLPVAGGAALLIVADRIAGPLRRTRAAVELPRSARKGTGRWLEARIAWRALGGSLAGAYLSALLPLGAAALFVRNNELPDIYIRLGALLGGGCAVVFLLAGLAESLAVRRPAWPWSRSLPWPASRRVLFDALFLGAHALPLVFLTAWIEPVAALAVLAEIPLLAVRSSGAVRRAPERRTGASGEILLEGLMLAAAVALLPWVSLFALLGLPLAVRAAAERERRQKVSGWQEIHHLAAGDPQSWSSG